jgi:hypothetical protein
MKLLRLITLAVWTLSQLAAAAPVMITGSAGTDGYQLVSSVDLHGISGGVCSTCNEDPPPDPEPRRKEGSPYWEHSGSSNISRTNPSGTQVWHRRNTTSSPLTVTSSYQYREELSWSVSGGVPSGIVQGSLGKQSSITRTETDQVTIAPGWQLKLFVAYPVSRDRHTFIQYQDYSDATRTQVGSGSATSSSTSTLSNYVDSPL